MREWSIAWKMSVPTSLVGTPERVSDPARRLTREQVVDRILSLNPTVDADYLREFSESSLADYLRRLDSLAEPRGRRAVWVRPAARAIVSRRRRW